MKTDVTTPTVVGFLQENPDNFYSAAMLAEQTGLNPGTVNGWFSKKLNQVPISVSKIGTTRMYRYDADKVVTEQAPKPRRRKSAKARKAVASPRRKAGREYAEIIWRDGPNMALILTTGELVKGVVV